MKGVGVLAAMAAMAAMADGLGFPNFTRRLPKGRSRRVYEHPSCAEEISAAPDRVTIEALLREVSLSGAGGKTLNRCRRNARRRLEMLDAVARGGGRGEEDR